MPIAPILKKYGYKPHKAEEGETCERCGADLHEGEIIYAVDGYTGQSGDYCQEVVCNYCRHEEARLHYNCRKHQDLFYLWVAIQCNIAKSRAFNRRERKIIRTKFER